MVQGVINPDKLVIKGLVGLSTKQKHQNDKNALLIKGITR